MTSSTERYKGEHSTSLQSEHDNCSVEQRFDITKWLLEWRSRLASQVAAGGGLDVYREWLGASAQIEDGPTREQAKAEIWDAAVAHSGDEVGVSTLAAIYTAVIGDVPPGDQEELDEAALRDGQRRDDDAEVARLARLPALAYDQVRKEAAKRIGVRASVSTRRSRPLGRVTAAPRDKVVRFNCR
jgi:hypothetical protein